MCVKASEGKKREEKGAEASRWASPRGSRGGKEGGREGEKKGRDRGGQSSSWFFIKAKAEEGRGGGREGRRGEIEALYKYHNTSTIY